MNNDDWIAELQSKVAFLEAAIDTLSDEFYAQQKQLTALNREHQRLRDKLVAMETSDSDQTATAVDERPPHY